VLGEQFGGPKGAVPQQRGSGSQDEWDGLVEDESLDQLDRRGLLRAARPQVVSLCRGLAIQGFVKDVRENRFDAHLLFTQDGGLLKVGTYGVRRGDPPLVLQESGKVSQQRAGD
jgi:hypothetical protein